MKDTTNNAEWLKDELLDIAGLPEIEHEPELQRLKADCKERGFPQRIADLRKLLAAALSASDEVDEKVPEGRLLVNGPTDYMDIAKCFIADRYQTGGGVFLLAKWQGEFYRWEQTHWEGCLPDEMGEEMWNWIEDRVFFRSSDGLIKMKPNVGTVANCLAALSAISARDGRLSLGWAPGTVDPIENVMPVENGLLDLDTLECFEHDPALFNTVYVAAPWRVTTPPPFEETEFGRWMKATLIDEKTGEGEDQLPMLQEFLGLLMMTDTSFQKMGMIVGPRRSGKGTLARIITKMLGGKVANVGVNSMSNSFPMQKLVGKTVAILPDVRLGKHAKHEELTEMLLSVSGEDAQSVNRKHTTDWEGTLDVRFLFLSNSIPHLRDHDGVLASRFLYFRFPNSKFGREDVTLGDRLWEDRASFLRWAVEGFQRLKAQGHFTLSAHHSVAMERATIRMDPVGVFVEQVLTVTGDEDDFVSVYDLYALFREFTRKHQMPAFSKVGFTKSLWAKDVDGMVKDRRRVSMPNPRKEGEFVETQLRVATGVRVTDPPSEGDMQALHTAAASEPDED